MRRAVFFLGAVLLAAAGFADPAIEAANIVDHPFSAGFASGGRLRLRVRSGDVRIVGTNEDRISVELSGRNAERAREVRVRLTEKHGDAVLRISGGPHNEVVTTIRIPRRTNLFARIPFGDVSVENVEGDKDVAVHAGDLTIDVGNPADYGHVDASVNTGDLNGQPFGESKDGLFRSFHKEGSGKYRLRAHVGAGDLTLR
ncbi:MAG TPA: hypothetical protein VKH46_11430 [Thermoanaerobaculia bacterium]|nr:hypothetical protein [Thermoanaerobaculia bacterium]